MRRNKVRFESSSDELEEDKDFFEDNEDFEKTPPKSKGKLPLGNNKLSRMRTEPLITHQMTMFSPQAKSKQNYFEVGLMKSKTKVHTFNFFDAEKKIKETPRELMK